MAMNPEVDDDVKRSDGKKAESPPKEDAFTKSLPADPTKTTAKQQRVLMKKLGVRNQVAGESWFPIDRKWYDSWKKYTLWDKGDDDIDGGLDALDDGEYPRPGPIDNSDLQDPNDENALSKALTENMTHIWIHSEVWHLLHSWYGGGPAFERKVYERGGTFSTLKEKYICVHPRLVRLCFCDDQSGDIDLSKTTVKGFPVDYHLSQVVKELEAEMEWNGEEKDEEKQQYLRVWLRMGQIKEIYKLNTPNAVKKGITISLDDLNTLDQQQWVEIPDDYLKTELNDLIKVKEPSAADPTEDAAAGTAGAAGAVDAVADGVQSMAISDDAASVDDAEDAPQELIIVVERRQEDADAPWPRAKGEDWRETMAAGDIVDVKDDQNKWYEGMVRWVYPEGHEKFGQFVVHYIGWNVKWDEPLEVKDEERVAKRNATSKGPHRPKKAKSRGGHYESSWSWSSHENGAPDQQGVVGLRNLGNTCFMNSTIQCLAQSPGLTEYFLDNEYMHHINKENPLGWKGKVANAWAMLLHDMFSGKYRVVAPRQFKSAIGESAPRFMGYAQQDSQELLSFLLDGLHEDLNQIKKKPMTQPVDSNGRPDTVVAQEAWKTYLSRNQSKIVDLMQAQYRSEVVCPDCGRVSVTFDPYMFLSVPLPTEKHKVIEYSWISSDTSVHPVVFGQKILKVADIGMLKEAVAKVHGVAHEELFVCDVWKSKIHRELRRHDSVGDINRKSDDIFIYHSPRPDPKEYGDGKEPAAGDVAGAEKAGAERDRYDDERAGGGYGGRYGGNLRRKKQDFQTFVINHQHRVRSRHQYGAQERFEDEPIGYPLLMTLPMTVAVTMRQIRARIWTLIQPFLVDSNLTIDDEWPFGLWACWGFNQNCQIQDDDEVFGLNQRNLRFVVQWKGDAKGYKAGLYDMNKRARDDSAPKPMSARSSVSAYDSDARRRGGKPIELSECLHAFCEKETLSENDAWYCSQCKDFKCASKQIDLWDSPDLLIIHLKRFNYTRNWRDRINTLVKFPIKGLELSSFLLSEDHKKDAVYDLYAVSNHMGGMGGGHYTAYAKNLDNAQWYHLDDSRTSKVGNTQNIVSSSAYVLYYYKVNPRKLKHRASRVKIPDIDSDGK